MDYSQALCSQPYFGMLPNLTVVRGACLLAGVNVGPGLQCVREQELPILVVCVLYV